MPTIAELGTTYSTLNFGDAAWTVVEIDGVTGRISTANLRTSLKLDPLVLQGGAISLGSSTGTLAYIGADGAARFKTIALGSAAGMQFRPDDSSDAVIMTPTATGSANSYFWVAPNNSALSGNSSFVSVFNTGFNGATTLPSNFEVLDVGFEADIAIVRAGATGSGLHRDISVITGNTSRLYVQAGGFVGIGTTSPLTKAQIRDDVNGANAAQLTLEGQAGLGNPYAGLRFKFHTFQTTGWGGDIQAVDAAIYVTDLLFRTANGGNETTTPTERMRLTGAGNLGLGTTVPAARLHVVAPAAGDEVQRLESATTNDYPRESVYQARATTSDATATTLHSFTVPASGTWAMEVTVVARRTGGTGGTAGDGGAFKMMAAYKNVSGTVSIIGTATTLFSQASAGLACAFGTPSGAAVPLQVTGVAANDFTWHLTARTYQVTA